ncbi:CsbD family protein [Glycomyces sp. NPDC049804]|uniref:CsbD family protein n=1 Tax=Glycomyces sp. NPDC049804 TaxID=3154363 RepID=UPI003441E69E
MGGFDKAKDKTDQLVGKAKEKVGDATDNESLANEGRAQELKGKAKEEWHDLRDRGEEELRDAKRDLTGDDK